MDEMNFPENRIKKPRVFTGVAEAWRLIDGLKWPVFKRALAVVSLIILLSFLLFVLVQYTQENFPGVSPFFPLINFITKLLIAMMAIRLWAPVLMMGVRRAIGLPVELKSIQLQCAEVESSLLVLSLIDALILGISSYYLNFLAGDILFWFVCRVLWQIAVIIILAPIVFFAFPLVIAQKAPVSSALMRAYKTMYANWGVVVGSCLTVYIPVASLLGLILLYGLYNPLATQYIFPITKLILSIWLLPLIVTVGGVLFRNLYRLRKSS